MLHWLYGRAGKAADAGRSTRATNAGGGLAAGTFVATAKGWCPVEEIRVGDEIITFDDGMQAVTGVNSRLEAPHGDEAAPTPMISVPAGVIGNRRPILVTQKQAVMVESDMAKAILGEPFALIEAKTLSRLGGTRKMRPQAPVTTVTLTFETPQMIFVEGEALIYCPSEEAPSPVTLEAAVWGRQDVRYPVLPKATAEMVVASLEIRDLHAPKGPRLTPHPGGA
ncbi:Hint domain-containing protein [Tropicimonas isoalkanivorans]|uniref:Hint domain-containing protein n=1 Tax=Tropicimonas isoalkanivorans TaxID=441112 RepID=A0A1I1QP32_9RHOB|nr:Hint domain-containing protein [Tropicimonas isoalkanivorans]SFD23777.1 Hint domain-containing protein [Tropicimonas isoalkanivorans]